MIRLLMIVAILALSACGSRTPELDPNPQPIGDFRLGFNVVVANDVQKAPVSRDATEEELTSAVRAAMEERIGRYSGNGLYHIGLRIEAYSLGRAGVPVLFSPRSVLLIAMNIWDDSTQQRINEEPIRITAFEGEAGPLTGSGAARGREDQLRLLAFDAAKEVEEVLIQNADAWFRPKPGQERLEFERDPLTGLQAQGEGASPVTAPVLSN